MSLYLIDLVEWQTVNVNSTWSWFISHSCKQSLLVACQTYLWNNHAWIISCLWVLWMPYSLVIANNEDFIRFSWNVNNTCHCNILLIEVTLIKPGQSLLLDYQVKEIHIAIGIARSETHIIVKPVNWTHFMSVTLALVIGRTLASIEVVDINCIIKVSTCKEMSTTCKSNFSARFNLNLLNLIQRLWEHVHHKNLVIKSYYYMEATWMKGNTKCLFRNLVNNLKSSCGIVPYSDSLILRACNNERFTDAEIKTCYNIWVEIANHIVKFAAVICSI